MNQKAKFCCVKINMKQGYIPNEYQSIIRQLSLTSDW